MLALHGSDWLQQIQHMLDGAIVVAKYLDTVKRSVVIHCSDGWDRTSCLCSLVQLMLDPYCRTLEGFPRLIHKDWLAFGHRFETRSGTGPSPQEKEVAPVFLLFLDCVYQMQRQFFKAFEFSAEYLVVLLDASLSGEFGTFLFDSEKQRMDSRVYHVCESVWSALGARKDLRNPHYVLGDRTVVMPSSNMALLELWSAVYLRMDVSANHEKDKSLIQLQDEANVRKQTI